MYWYVLYLWISEILDRDFQMSCQCAEFADISENRRKLNYAHTDMETFFL